MFADCLILSLGFAILILILVQGITSAYFRNDSAIAILAVLIILVSITELLNYSIPDKYLVVVAWVAVTSFFLALVHGKNHTKASELLEKEFEYYKDLLEKRMKAECPSNGNISAEAVEAAVVEVLYEELSAVDRKLSFTLGIAATVAIFHGFTIRELAFPGNGTASTELYEISAIMAVGGLISAFVAIGLILRPRAVWLGEEAAKQNGLLDPRHSLIRERRHRDRSYRFGKICIYISAFLLIIGYIFAIFEYAYSIPSPSIFTHSNRPFV